MKLPSVTTFNVPLVAALKLSTDSASPSPSLSLASRPAAAAIVRVSPACTV